MVFAFAGRTSHLPFFDLPYVLRPCRYPYPADCPASIDGSSAGHASLRPFCRDSAVSVRPLTGFRAVPFRGGSFLVMLRPARLLGRLDQPPPFACATDRPTRLRQSLLQPESPPVEVCYHYSAQPPIAEAGFSPARMSRIEGCTQNHGRTESFRLGLVMTSAPGPGHRKSARVV